MDIKTKMNHKFRDLQGGLFLNVSKADVGEGASVFQKAGGDVMAWADMFYPDPSIPESGKKATMEAVSGGFPSHYTLPVGMYELRQAIAEHVSERIGRPIDPSRNVIVNPGSDNGLLFSMMPFICEGDEILIPDPSYPSNYLNCKLLDGVPVPVPTYPEDNYRIRIEEMEKRGTPKTKMVLLTHPNNPTTVVYRKDNLQELADFIIKHDLILVCDQAFEDHIFDGIEFVSPCTLPGMWERTVTGVKMKMSESGILSWLDISALGTSQEVADYLLEHAKIMVNQGTPYGAQGEGHIRIVTACFAKDEDALIRFERIKASLTELAKTKGLL